MTIEPPFFVIAKGLSPQAFGRDAVLCFELATGTAGCQIVGS
jgi:hypothetical protein